MSPGPGSAPAGRGGQTRAAREAVYRETGFGPMLRRSWRRIAIGFTFFFLLFVWYGFQPLNGGTKVGICRTLIELQLKYPATLKFSDVEWYKNTLQIYLTHVDAYGQNQSEFFECDFNPDLTLSDARRNRVSLSPDDIKNFNMTIPYIITSKPNNVVPRIPKDDLLGLQQN
jgi:hypothetical protein